MTFTVYGKPQGKARPRITKRGHAYTPQQTVEYEERIKQAFIKSKEKGYFNNEPIGMLILASYPVPKSMSKKDRELIEKGCLTPTKKPDIDNIAKVVCDALNGVAYSDDKQIVMLTIAKKCSEEPKITVTLYEVQNETQKQVKKPNQACKEHLGTTS